MQLEKQASRQLQELYIHSSHFARVEYLADGMRIVFRPVNKTIGYVIPELEWHQGDAAWTGYQTIPVSKNIIKAVNRWYA